VTFELHPLALLKSLSCSRDAGRVDEDILPTIVGRDEPVALSRLNHFTTPWPNSYSLSSGAVVAVPARLGVGLHPQVMDAANLK
jgi:hypothetical protein